jgi:regulator of protease activity HflC (stomatin/prohibitin superfamily)
LQRVDSEYATTDFSSFHAALQYFTNLCGPWLGSPQVFCRSLTLVTEHDEALRDAVHTILCDAGEKAHEVLVSVEESHELLVGRNPEEFGRILKALVMSSKMSETVTRTIRDVVKPAMEALKPLMMQELEARRDKAAEILDARRDKAADILRVKLKNMEQRRAAREKDADKRHEILG